MATWMVHCRIADRFLEIFKDSLEPTEFVIGSLAPDCGWGDKDSLGQFDPPPRVTHWSPSGNKNDCRYKDFRKAYLTDRARDDDYSFYLGYYVHLLTDIMWSSEMFMRSCDRYDKELKKDGNFVKVIKNDWNDLDMKYHRDNPDMKSYRILDKVKSVKNYLPYYEDGQLTKQLRWIARYYRNGADSRNLDREYKYASEKRIDDFVNTAAEIIEGHLRQKALI